MCGEEGGGGGGIEIKSRRNTGLWPTEPAAASASAGREALLPT